MADKCYIGVDLGGTKALGAIIEGDRLVEDEIVKIHGMGKDELLSALQDLVQRFLDKRSDVAAIGLGVPSQIDQKNGVAVASVNLPIENLPIRDEFQKKFDLPVSLDNDANCAAYAEAHVGAGKGSKVLVCLTVGTGIGSGVVIDGKIFRGSQGYATEAGHMIVDIDSPYADGWPKPGSLESFSSGKALESMADGISGEEVLAAARSGYKEMGRVFERLARNLGVGIANMINIFNPDVVVIGGGVSSAGELLIDPARKEAAKWALDAPMSAAKIVIAELGPEAGVIGAALVARDSAL